MPTVLLLSPHLDDVVFSCGGIAARLADRGWRTILVTAFTASIHPARGFALACQLDKGLPPETDYMALRRGEDEAAAAALGIGAPAWLGLPEAPHRGYASAAALFAGRRGDDDIADRLAPRLAALVGQHAPDVVLAPQGLGNHVDHLQLIHAALRAVRGAPLAWYRDTPYAIRHPGARPAPMLPEGMHEACFDIAPALPRKIRAACLYASQVGFQFGGAAAAAAALATFAAREAAGEDAAAKRGGGSLAAEGVHGEPAAGRAGEGMAAERLLSAHPPVLERIGAALAPGGR